MISQIGPSTDNYIWGFLFVISTWKPIVDKSLDEFGIKTLQTKRGSAILSCQRLLLSL